MTVDFDGSREDCPLLADLSEARGSMMINRSSDQAMNILNKCLRGSPELLLLASGSTDMQVVLYDLKTMKFETALSRFQHVIAAVDFLPKRCLLVVADQGGHISFWRMRPHPDQWTCIFHFRNLPIINGVLPSVTEVPPPTLAVPPSWGLLVCCVLLGWISGFLSCLACSNHDAGIELHISLPGDLRVTVTGPASSAARAAELLGHISLFESVASSARSDRSFEVVSSVAESVGEPVPRGRSETRDSILQSFRPCPDRLLVRCSRLCGSSLSGKDRIHRAWLAGQWAAAVCSNRIGSPNRTPAIDLRPRFYAVLRGAGLDCPTIFRSSAGYWRCIGSLESSSSISQSFPSEIEAKIYLESAGVVDVEFAP
eukprot:s1247_g29.t1